MLEPESTTITSGEGVGEIIKDGGYVPLTLQ